MHNQMKTQITIFSLLLLLFGTPIWSQGNKIILINREPLDTTRYDDFKGSPYLFDKLVKVNIKGVNGEEFKGLKGNYNGFDNDFEIVQNGSYIRLPSKIYPEIMILKSDNPSRKDVIRDTLIIRSNINSKLSSGYHVVLHEGDKYILANYFYVKDYENTVQTPGVATSFRRFNRKNELAVIMDDTIVKFKLSTKNIQKAFSDDPYIQQYIKSTKNKLNSEQALIEMFDEID